MTTSELRTLAAAGELAQLAAPLPAFDQTVNALAPGDYMMEPKYDGWRILAFVGDGTVDLFARSGNQYNGRLPAVEAELLTNFPAGTVLDGEAVALVDNGDGTFKSEWSVAQSVMTKLGGGAADDRVTFMVFDLIAHAGIDARSAALADRRVLLERIFDGDPFDNIQLSTIVEACDESYDALVDAGLEGAVVKNLAKPYSSGKREGAGWTKFKARARVDGVVMGCNPGEKSNTGLVGSLVFGQFDEATGMLVERGSVGSGLTQAQRVEATKNPGDPHVEVSDKWLGAVIEVAHNGVDIAGSGSGRFRHPTLKRVRKDKAAEQVLIHNA